MSLLELIDITQFSFIIIAFLGIIVSFIFGLRNVIFEDKKNEPLIEEGKKSIEEKIEKLGLSSPRIPLYFDMEKLETLFAQSEMRKYSMKIDSIKRTSKLLSNNEVDAKLLKGKIETSEEQEHTFKEFKTKENQYEKILSWLCEQDRLTIIEDENSNYVQLSKELNKLLKKVQTLNIADEIEKTLTKINELTAQTLEKSFKKLNNRSIFITGEFEVMPPQKEDDFAILIYNQFQFYINGSIAYCSKAGRENLTGKRNSNKITVFGYVKDTHEESQIATIEPIAIHHLLS